MKWLLIAVFMLGVAFVVASGVSGEWKDVSGDLIINASIGDIVLMTDDRYNGTVLNNGDMVVFEIIENDGLGNPDEYIRTRSLGNPVIGHYNGTLAKAVANWTITSEDLERTPGDYEEFKFRTGIDDYTKSSPFLNISDIVEDSEPNVSIIDPTCGTVVYLDDPYVIEIGAEDSDDFVYGNLTIIDGVDDDVPDFTFENGLPTFNYDFDVSGNIGISIDAINSGGVKVDYTSSVIVIDPTVDADYLAACITSPAVLLTDSNRVLFNASASKGVRYEAGSESVIPIEDMTFNWRFTDIFTGDVITNPISDGSDPNAYLFELTFGEVGVKRVSLEVVV